MHGLATWVSEDKSLHPIRLSLPVHSPLLRLQLNSFYVAEILKARHRRHFSLSWKVIKGVHWGGGGLLSAVGEGTLSPCFLAAGAAAGR